MPTTARPQPRTARGALFLAAFLSACGSETGGGGGGGGGVDAGTDGLKVAFCAAPDPSCADAASECVACRTASDCGELSTPSSCPTCPGFGADACVRGRCVVEAAPRGQVHTVKVSVPRQLQLQSDYPSAAAFVVSAVTTGGERIACTDVTAGGPDFIAQDCVHRATVSYRARVDFRSADFLMIGTQRAIPGPNLFVAMLYDEEGEPIGMACTEHTVTGDETETVDVVIDDMMQPIQ